MIDDESEYCDNCNCELHEEDFVGEYEPMGEFWGAPASQYICVGYKCPKCGYIERF